MTQTEASEYRTELWRHLNQACEMVHETSGEERRRWQARAEYWSQQLDYVYGN